MKRVLPSLLSLAVAAGLGCSTIPPACESMCSDAVVVYEDCMVKWDQQWGEATGYLDQDDYLNWCDTFIIEQQELAWTRWGADGPTRVKQTCREQHTKFRLFGNCNEYLDSWELWDEYTRPAE